MSALIRTLLALFSCDCSDCGQTGTSPRNEFNFCQQLQQQQPELFCPNNCGLSSCPFLMSPPYLQLEDKSYSEPGHSDHSLNSKSQQNNGASSATRNQPILSNESVGKEQDEDAKLENLHRMTDKLKKEMDKILMSHKLHHPKKIQSINEIQKTTSPTSLESMTVITSQLMMTSVVTMLGKLINFVDSKPAERNAGNQLNAYSNSFSPNHVCEDIGMMGSSCKSCLPAPCSNVRPRSRTSTLTQPSINSSSPIKIIACQAYSACVLFVQWNTCCNAVRIDGYQIFVDDVLKARVHAPTRKSALLPGVDTTIKHLVTVYAVPLSENNKKKGSYTTTPHWPPAECWLIPSPKPYCQW